MPTLKRLFPDSSVTDLMQHADQFDVIDDTDSYTKHRQHIDRLPTLYEVLNRKTESPVDLWNFYIFMRDQNSVDYLDFWIDVVTHLRHCKEYVKGLRESLLLSEKLKNSDNSNSTGNNTSSSNEQNRASISSSLLLEALINEGLLDDKDNKRVSAFLQGNEIINTTDPRITSIFKDDKLQQPAEIHDEIQPQQPHFTHISSPSKIYSSDSHSSDLLLPESEKPEEIRPVEIQKEPTPVNGTRVLPDLLENYTRNVKNGNITRATLRSSSKNILNTYFKENSSKSLRIPERIKRKIIHDIEIQGRDDPEVFEDAKEYVYLKLERENFPFFLKKYALHNLSNLSCLIRLISSLVFLFIAFWLSYIFIFIDLKPKAIRAVIIAPFLLGIYCLITFLYKLDPIMVFFNYSDNYEYKSPDLRAGNPKKNRMIVKNLNEPFVKKLLMKRSIWVVSLILFISACFCILFGLVPGYRI